jgi:hypothetical protein
MAAPTELSTRLQKMLHLNSSGSSIDAPASSSSVKKPLIEIVDDGPISPSTMDGDKQPNHTGSDDDDPPPITFHSNESTKHPQAVGALPKTSNLCLAEPSLAEQMMEHADRAAQAKKKEEDSKRQKNATKVSIFNYRSILNCSI